MSIGNFKDKLQLSVYFYEGREQRMKDFRAPEDEYYYRMQKLCCRV